MVQRVDGVLHHLAHLLEVRPVGHAELHHGQHVAVVLRQVLIVLAEQLAVLKRDHLAVERLHHRRRVADRRHLAHRAVHLDPVAHLDAAGHQRGTVVDVLDDVLRGKADTCRQTARNGQQPPHADVEQRQRREQPYAPDEHLDDVLAHHLLAVGRRRVLPVVVQTQQRQDRPRDVGEQEPQAHHHRQLHDAHLQVLQVDEVLVVYLPAQVAQVEDACSPVEGQHHRQDTHHRQRHAVHQQVEPRLRDGLLLQLVAVVVQLQVLADARDGQYARQLHDPPDEYLHRQQRVAHPRAHHRGHEDGQRDVRVENVRLRDVRVVALDHPPLPQRAQQQGGGEDHVHQLARDEHDAEGDDDEPHQYQRRVDVERTLDLVAVHTQQQRHQDDAQQPRILDEQAARHDVEVLVDRSTQQAHDGSKRDGRRSHDDARPLLQKLLRVQTLRHQPESQQVQQHSHDDVERYQHEQPDDDHAVPLRVATPRAVLLVHRLHSLPQLRAEVAYHREVVVAAVLEYAALNVVVALVGIVVQVLQPLLRVLVERHVVGHLLAVLLQRVLDVRSQRQTHRAVNAALLVERLHVHRLQARHQAVVLRDVLAHVAQKRLKR